MESAILPTISIDKAKEKQFDLVNAIASEFTGNAFFNQGDLGVFPELGRPVQTDKVEKVLASFFKAESCALVRGAGTGAIRETLASLLSAGDSLFVHSSPIYKTTNASMSVLGLQPIFTDYNDLKKLRRALAEHPSSKLFYVQHSRQKPDDTYDLETVINLVKEVRPDLPIVVDDNYTVFKVDEIGTELGAHYSCFSGFKLLGPVGIGIILGKQAGIDKFRQRNYSGGGQVQGYEAMDLLRSLVTAPILIAVQNEQTEKLNSLLNSGVIPEIEKSYITNSQSKNVIIELKKPIAEQVIAASEKFGGAVYPVGAESKFEILPMIYRLSGSFLDEKPELKHTGIRINPMRSGAELVIEILKQAIAISTNEGAYR
ncbi:aminotransferase class V-fold PLP-dependent enzyme [Thalassobacillus devorans]|uniref:aminotransferase class V-fold PLP-dependent enzyme n=1 Tax=Thalassobacillus devorans TaxID=279813 RepID=UPI00111C23DA|nr:aminotransferase class V-fold PLP-dependent enzyme [Thalassobacillus devorans]